MCDSASVKPKIFHVYSPPDCGDNILDYLTINPAVMNQAVKFRPYKQTNNTVSLLGTGRTLTSMGSRYLEHGRICVVWT